MIRSNRLLKSVTLMVALSLLTACAAGAGGSLPAGAVSVDGAATGKVSEMEYAEMVEASGVLQADQFATLSWKINGTVTQVNVEVGDQVKAGDTLMSLDPVSAPANVISARSDLLSAQQSLDDLLNSKLPQAQALQALEEAQRAFDDRELNLESDQAQAMLALIDAQNALDDAQYSRDKLNYDRASKSTMDAAEADYLLAKMELEQAESKYGNVEGRADDDPGKALAIANLSAAQEKVNRALARVNWLKGDPDESEIQEADVKLQQAQVKLAETQKAWDVLKDGLSPAEVALLDARLADAQRAYEQIKKGPNQAEVAQLEARIQAAEATLNQLTLSAPFEGEVLVMNHAAGDVIQAGEAGLVLANRQALHVDVQVDESEVGRVQVGAKTALTLETLPDQELAGVVGFVNPVGQTVGGLVKYTVRVDIQDAPAGLLLGTTADVTIQAGEPQVVLVVPVDAVQNDAEGEYVLKVGADNVPLRVNVHSGVLVGDQVVVTGDLQAGDALVLNAPSLDAGPGGMIMGR